MGEYTVALSNTFEADSFRDALEQMVVWVSECANSAGYRISWTELVDGIREDRSVFVDAERVLGDIYG
jgi:diaminopimelate decarboxylase